MMRKSMLTALLIAAALLVLTGCACRHQFGEWEIAQEPTCTDEGVYTRTCEKCGESETAPIPVTGHSYTAWKTVEASTCVHEGSQSRTCSNCGAEEIGAVALAEHTYGEWEIIEASTCVMPGIGRSSCAVCGAEEEQDLPLAEHTVRWSVEQEATCTAPGSQTGTCSVCGAAADAVIEATGHDWQAATCQSPEKCSRCGETQGDIAGHTWKAATCTAAKHCAVCGTTEGSAPGHSYGSSGKCGTCGGKMGAIKLKIPSVGTFNGYASLVVTNYTDSAITFPKLLSINGKLCNGSEYSLAPGSSATLTYYRAILPSERYSSKHCDMYLDNNSEGYCVMKWNGTQYYAEYGVNGITTFYRGNVNGPA